MDDIGLVQVVVFGLLGVIAWLFISILWKRVEVAIPLLGIVLALLAVFPPEDIAENAGLRLGMGVLGALLVLASGVFFSDFFKKWLRERKSAKKKAADAAQAADEQETVTGEPEQP